jgi:protein SCO1/2
MRRIVILLLALAIAYAAWYGIAPILKKQTPAEIKAQVGSQQQADSGYAVATILSPPKPLVEFTLTDTNNQPFTHRSLQNHWTLMFFGYAQCPDICPTTLAIVGQTWRSFPNGTPHPNAQLVFVSLDPKDDTVPKLRGFLERFHPSFIGLTGGEQDIKQLAEACRIYSWTDPKLNAAGQKVIDHSATLLLINPEGQIQALFSPPHNADNIAKDIKSLMNR